MKSKEWTFKESNTSNYGLIGFLKHNSYNVTIVVYSNVFYINGKDASMIPISSKLLKLVDSFK